MEVVCAVAINGNNKIFAARRAEGKPHAGTWEFPGGKVEEGETPKSALIREIKEEMGVTLNVGELIKNLEWENKLGAFSLSAFACQMQEDGFTLSDHDEYGWFTLDELSTMELMIADYALLNYVEMWLKSKS